MQIVRNQIDEDGFYIFQNKVWSEWYLIKKQYRSKHCDTQGNFNVYEELGRFNSEFELLDAYLNIYME